MSILASGALNASKGIAGFGVYGFMISVDNDSPHDDFPSLESIHRTFRRGSSYGQGVAFVLRTRGVLINSRNSADLVPLGATAKKKDQFAVNERSFHIEAVLWDEQVPGVGSPFDPPLLFSLRAPGPGPGPVGGALGP